MLWTATVFELKYQSIGIISNYMKLLFFLSAIFLILSMLRFAMKKLLITATLLTFTFSFSQSFGAKGGLNISKISSSGWDDSDPRIGWYAGLYVHMPTSPVFAVQTELLYNSLGGKHKISNQKHTLTLDYISLPIMYQFKFLDNFFVEGGPQLSFLVNNRDKYKSGSKTVIESDSDRFNKFDFSLALGAGARIRSDMKLTARYTIGFTDINKKGETGFSNHDNKLRNRAFQFGIQYGF